MSNGSSKWSDVIDFDADWYVFYIPANNQIFEFFTSKRGKELLMKKLTTSGSHTICLGEL